MKTVWNYWMGGMHGICMEIDGSFISMQFKEWERMDNLQSAKGLEGYAEFGTGLVIPGLRKLEIWNINPELQAQ